MLTLVLGGPGCGKTAKLLEIIDGLLTKGVGSTRIAYLTFTKKAANEGLNRSMDKFDLQEKDLPYFRTIHSLAFQQLALDSNRVMTLASWKEFGNATGLNIAQMPLGEGELPTGVPACDQLSCVQLSRLLRKPLRGISQDNFISPDESEYVSQSLVTFKRNRNLVDFTDMLETFLVEGIVPPIDYLIVDEGQDLSTLQWLIVEKLRARATHTWIAGDDDQAIYEWAGADVDYFLNLEGEKIVLPISYRLKKNVYDVAQMIVRGIKNRYVKDWGPHTGGGEVEWVNQLGQLKLQEGSWYLLARSHYLLTEFRDYLRREGYPYIDAGQSSTDNDKVRAMIYWEHLRRGDEVDGRNVRGVFAKLRKHMCVTKKPILEDDEMYSLGQLREAHGLLTDAPWFDAIQMTTRESEYYRACRQRGESLLATPRITLATIHGVKGGEADHVFLSTDMPTKSYENMENWGYDEETRVFYVGVSRAKKSLVLRYPQTQKYYRI